MNSDNKSTRELKGEVMHDLRKLNRDIDDFRNNLSPGRVIDDVLNYRSRKSPKATLEHLRSNPIGTSFLALGTLLLAESERGSFERLAKDSSSNAYDGARARAGAFRSKFDERADSFRGKLEDAKASLKSRLPKSAPDIIAEGPSEFGIRDRATESLRNVRAKLSSLSDSVKSGRGRAQERLQGGFESAKNQEPLTYVALGAGLGALTGASLPVSEKEMDFADSRYSERISDFKRDLEKALNESSNILKNEFIKDFSLVDLEIFKSKSA